MGELLTKLIEKSKKYNFYIVRLDLTEDEGKLNAIVELANGTPSTITEKDLV